MARQFALAASFVSELATKVESDTVRGYVLASAERLYRTQEMFELSIKVMKDQDMDEPPRLCLKQHQCLN